MNALLLKSEIGIFRRIIFIAGAFFIAFICYKALEETGGGGVVTWLLAGGLGLFALLSLTAPIWLAEIFIYEDRIVVKKIGGLYYKTILRSDITRFDVKKTPKVMLLRFYNGDEKVFTLSSENYENFEEMRDLLLRKILVPGSNRPGSKREQPGETPSDLDKQVSPSARTAHIQLPLIPELPHDHILNIYIQGANSATDIDGGYAATLVAAYTRYLAERPDVRGGAEWLSKVQSLVLGIPVQQGIANSIYVDLIEME
ncbi:MAG: hypothetical protein DYG98_24245 [Haliscomenobacteraceae bacterium CHB4]|nr:hypothetical protein [Saprospiraceae bacterium]MCE7926169.1 hypothetical protein [Haliscomenobacteraceae bacterium CHB4]